MNEEDRRRHDKAWNDPPMFSYDQLNKQPNSSIPFNRRYKYPVPDQQAMNNPAYSQGTNFPNMSSYNQQNFNQYPNSYPPNQNLNQQQGNTFVQPNFPYNQPSQPTQYNLPNPQYPSDTMAPMYGNQPNAPIVSQPSAFNQNYNNPMNQKNTYLPNQMINQQAVPSSDPTLHNQMGYQQMNRYNQPGFNQGQLPMNPQQNQNYASKPYDQNY